MHGANSNLGYYGGLWVGQILQAPSKSILKASSQTDPTTQLKLSQIGLCASWR
jgi:hypothetical protein